jgi:hypothetical protein
VDPTSLPRFEYTRDDARRRIRVTARETFNRDDLVAIVDRQLQDDAWSYGMLYDMRSLSDAISRADAIAFAEYVRECGIKHGPRGPVALVTRSMKIVGAGQAYAFDVGKQGFVVEVFWDIDEATAWLDTQPTVSHEEHKDD